MDDIRIRGIPPRVYRLIQQDAKKNHLSVNDYMIRLIRTELKRYEDLKEAEKFFTTYYPREDKKRKGRKGS